MMKTLFSILACLAMIVAFTGCATAPAPAGGGDGGGNGGGGGDAVDQFETVRKAFDDWLSADPAPPGATKAAAVFDSLNDGDDSTTPFVLSVRSAEHFAIGHVPGAVNVPWRTVANEGALDAVPMDESIVVYCYTGHTGGVATACLNAMGYDAVNMKFGMTAWTMDEDIRVASPYNEETASDFDTETEINTVDGDNDLPALDVTDSEDEDEIIRAAAEAYLSANTPPVITAEDLFDLLNDGDETNDPFIISVRGPDDYAKGHIPGAINIPWKTIAKAENLAMIPTDRQVVIYCYTGHTGGLATTVLTVLGYDAINMKFGIMAWTKDAEVRAQSAFSEETEAHDYPTEP